MSFRYELEYTLNCSPKVLFSRLSTPEGLSEWFADNVTVEGNIFTFHWNKTQSKARLASLRENKLVRFEWIGSEDEETEYFEFRIDVHELTNDLALIIIDFAEPDEKEDAIYLWDTQITDLKRILGS
ncbi:MAG: START-like domain-containing protein [Bacteroidales bacterium]|jgi:uncharacterized protein YndB with AHSA1/START domain|nr:START-like domain-containing protein [Bacteroidales bacterium]